LTSIFNRCKVRLSSKKGGNKMLNKEKKQSVKEVIHSALIDALLCNNCKDKSKYNLWNSFELNQYEDIIVNAIEKRI